MTLSQREKAWENRNQELWTLQARMRTCRLCIDAGFHVVPPAVFSGRLGARVMIIGQAPGITEVRAGRPFNAGSGARLFQWFVEAGFQEDDFRKSQYMTAVTKCFPGKASKGNGDRVPSRAEQTLCRPYLDAEIEIVNPALILPIGRLAIDLFYPASLSLEKIIGTEKQVDGRWIVPLPHPSGASRWHQIPEHRQRIQAAITRIRKHRIRLKL